jgi:deoxyribose-phosphate aldolase
MDLTVQDIAKMIDHAALKPTSTERDLEAATRVAIEYRVASLCCLPHWAGRCAQMLAGSGVKPSVTIGFPHGAQHSAVKAFEARQALDDGAAELDMVVNIGKVLGRQWDDVREDIRGVIDPAHAAGAKVKVIFEVCYLSDADIIQLCKTCGELNADWVKTATGFGSGGATPESVALMRKHSPAHIQIKASGGIATLDDLLTYRALGATRIGASKTREILEECKRRVALKQ